MTAGLLCLIVTHVVAMRAVILQSTAVSCQGATAIIKSEGLSLKSLLVSGYVGSRLRGEPRSQTEYTRVLVLARTIAIDRVPRSPQVMSNLRV